MGSVKVVKATAKVIFFSIIVRLIILPMLVTVSAEYSSCHVIRLHSAGFKQPQSLRKNVDNYNTFYIQKLHIGSV